MQQQRVEIASAGWPSDEDTAAAAMQFVKAARALAMRLEPWAETLPPGIGKTNAIRRVQQLKGTASEHERLVVTR